MAEPGTDDVPPGESKQQVGGSTKGKSDLDIVAPGEEETYLDNRKHDFDRSVVWMQSAASGIQREKWGSKMQFLMSCIASAVGLGNVWRFPAVCARNGGATFLIPYVIVLFVIARPLFVLELTLGQFSSKGSVRCWDLCPALTGIGITGMISSVLLSTFYIMLLAWALIYSVIALMSICYQPMADPLWTNNTGRYFGEVIIGGFNFEQFSDRYPQSIIPLCHLVLALIFAWMIIWITMVFGVEASGKVAYVTALAPYAVLIILMVAGLCLPGMEVGLEYLFTPDISKLIDANTWFQAVGQCFFSLGIGFGGCIMFSSFNDFHNDIIRDVMIISVVDSVTSLLAGISLMTILGFQASKTYDSENQNHDFRKKCFDPFNKTKSTEYTVSVDDEKTFLKRCALEHIIGEQGGAGLAFVHYPAAMNEINKLWGSPIGTIFGLLFFLMLILLAVGSANGFVGTTVTIIADKKSKWKRSNIVSGVCAFSCFLGLIYTNKVGAEWFDVVDTHGVTAVVYVLAFLEVFAVVYVYGLKNFCDDVQYMRNGKKVGCYLILTWVALPILMFIIYLYWLITYEKPSKTWTKAVQAIAWIITVSCLLVIPVTIVCKCFEFKRNPWRRNIPLTACNILKAVFAPSPRWGPKDPQIRVGWKEYKSQREPSYHIFGKMKRGLYRLCSKREPTILPSPRLSYATAAAPGEAVPPESGLDSVNTATPGGPFSDTNIASQTPSKATVSG